MPIEKEFKDISKKDLIKIFEIACKSFSMEPDRLDMILINEVFSSRKIIKNEIVHYRMNLNFNFFVKMGDEKLLFYIEYNPKILNYEIKDNEFKNKVEEYFK